MKAHIMSLALVVMEGLRYYWEQLQDLWLEKLGVGIILSAISYYCGVYFNLFLEHTAIDRILVVLLGWAMVVDFFFGLWYARKTHSFSLLVFKRGLLKWPLYTMYVVLVAVLDITFARLSPVAAPILNIFLGSLIYAEILSILKSMEKLGIRVPPLLLTATYFLRDFINSAVKRTGRSEKVEDGNGIQAVDSMSENESFMANHDRGQTEKIQRVMHSPDYPVHVRTPQHRQPTPRKRRTLVTDPVEDTADTENMSHGMLFSEDDDTPPPSTKLN